MVPAGITYLELVLYLFVSFGLGALACKIALDTLVRARAGRDFCQGSGDHSGQRPGGIPSPAEPDSLYKSKPWAAL